MLITDRRGRRVHEISRGIGVATNNVAEYSALVAGLEWCADRGAHEVLVRSDSDLMVKQMNGVYRVKSAGLKPLHARASGIAARFERVSYEHVPREHNVRADRLANAGVDAWLAAGGSASRPAEPDPPLFERGQRSYTPRWRSWPGGRGRHAPFEESPDSTGQGAG